MSPRAPNPLADAIVRAEPDPRIRRVFGWYSERLLRKQFHALRAMPGTERAIAAIPASRGVSLFLLSHSSWWDPIVGSFLRRRFFGDREVRAPMDNRELSRFRFMRKLGIFGIDPDAPASLAAMLTYVEGEVARSNEMVLIVTPQGRFTDVRDPLVVRPGAAALAARLGVRVAVSVAIEYGFWNDRRPEVFLRAAPIAVPQTANTATSTGPSTGQWQRSIVEAMTNNSNELSAAVRSRDAAQFECMLGGDAKIHPVYDLWLRMTGRGRGIDVGHRRELVGETR